MFIKKGDVISINYIPPHIKTEERLLGLQEGWHFDCTCKRCVDSTEAGAMTSAIKCYECLEENKCGISPSEGISCIHVVQIVKITGT